MGDEAGTTDAPGANSTATGDPHRARADLGRDPVADVFRNDIRSAGNSSHRIDDLEALLSFAAAQAKQCAAEADHLLADGLPAGEIGSGGFGYPDHTRDASAAQQINPGGVRHEFGLFRLCGAS